MISGAASTPPRARLAAAALAACAIAAYAPEARAETSRAGTQDRAGADWWALQPLADPQPPAPSGLPPGWLGPIDRFVLAALAKKGLSPSPPAGRRELIRRATYDVLGLPPSPEEVGAFISDAAPDAYERLVDRLLASPRHGERWGRLWLDVVRFGESNGYERNVLYPNAWPFRDHVIASFNADKPFDRFIVEQLAGDALAPDEPDVEVATAFLVCGPYDDVGNQDPVAAAQIRADHLDDMVRAASEAFLGMTVGCARCHDHKFDPIPAADYYRMQAAFAGVWHGARTLATAAERRDREHALAPLLARRDDLARARAAVEERVLARAAALSTGGPPPLPRPDPYLTEDSFDPLTAGAVRLHILANDRDPRNGGGVRIDELEVWSDEPSPRNVALSAAGARSQGGDGRVAEDAAGAYGVHFVNDGKYDVKWLAPPHAVLTIHLARPERIRRVTFSSDRNRALGRDQGENTFVGEYRIEALTAASTWTLVADSARRAPVNDAFARERRLRGAMMAAERDELAALDRGLAEVDRGIGAVPGLRQVWAGELRASPPRTHLLEGGDPQRPGDEVLPASPEFLREAGRYELARDASGPRRRLALAWWIAGAANPLTPRVLVNRVWQSHFSTGIVDTPSDFGWLGGRPSHPELLDWLARRLIAHGWRLKPLHREILLSAAYRQTSRPAADHAGGTDPRDFDAGNRLYWRFPPRRLAAEEIRDTLLSVAGKLDLRMGGPGFRLYRYVEDNVATYHPLDVHGPETYRRAVYHQGARAARIDLLTDFDCPDNSIPAPTRVTTTSPLQALTLLNHRFTLDMAAALAARVTREAGGDEAAAVHRLFALTFARDPTDEEANAALALARAHGWAALARAQLNANEVLHVD